MTMNYEKSKLKFELNGDILTASGVGSQCRDTGKGNRCYSSINLDFNYVTRQQLIMLAVKPLIHGIRQERCEYDNNGKLVHSNMPASMSFCVEELLKEQESKKATSRASALATEKALRVELEKLTLRLAEINSKMFSGEITLEEAKTLFQQDSAMITELKARIEMLTDESD